jgi:hypothetical protein
MPDVKLTAAIVAERFRERYTAISGVLDEWERSKAAFLVGVGKECLTLIRQVLEPFPEHDVAGRKAARAQVVKEIEDQLPELEGIGAPQVNRWIRWAGAGEVICRPDDLTWPAGLKQMHLMVLEKFIEQHEPTAAFRFKEPWKNKLNEVRECIKGTIEAKASAQQLEEALDAEAEFPKPPEPREEPCPCAAPKSESSTPASSASTASSHSSSGHSAGSSKGTTTAAAGSKSASTRSAGKSPAPSPALASSKPKSAPSPTSSSAAPAPSSSAPTPKELAEQAFKLLQQPEILAGVFRRPWEPDKALAIADNLIRGLGEKDSQGRLALAKMVHRLRPVVLVHYEEFAQEGKYKLRLKDEPSVPTIEELVPAQLQEACQ